jgi:glyoxylase-like metal-dependent hydrolase (beta-lactamase superfamily II)
MIPLLIAALSIEPCAVVHTRARIPALLVRRGLPAGDLEMGFITYVVPTPEGLLVVDPAVGASTPEHAARTPFWVRATLPDFSRAARLGDALKAEKVRAILVTHLHWDHASGAWDLPGWPPMFAPEADLAWAWSLPRDSPHRLALSWGVLQPFRLDGPPRDGFPSSRDLFGDGSVIALPLPGHTPGSVGYLVAGKYFFIGDAAWETGVDKAKIAAAFADEDAPAAAQSLARIETARRRHPEWLVLPAHDLQAARALPACRR